MSFSAITLTGYRPEALKLCGEWMNHQLLYPEEWIVVHDSLLSEGMNFNHPTIQLRRIQPSIAWKEGDPSSQLRNLAIGLKYCSEDYVCFIEDDDYYSARYFTGIMKLLSNSRHKLSALGFVKRRYYHLPTRQYRRYFGVGYTSLAQTCVSKTVIESIVLPLLERYDGLKFDVRLWEAITDRLKKSDYLLTEQDSGCVGIKGMPGRKGLGIGHSPTKDWSRDTKLQTFKRWLGDDWIYYQDFLGET